MGGALSSSVSKLYSAGGTLPSYKVCDDFPGSNLVVIVKTWTPRADPSLWTDGAGLSDHHARASHRPRSQVNQMPLANNAVLALA